MSVTSPGPDPLSPSFYKGYLAGSRSSSTAANRFVPGTLDHRQWMDGWAEARKDLRLPKLTKPPKGHYT